MNRYGVYYKGVLAACHLTLNGAKIKAWQLVKERKWDIDSVEILALTKTPENVSF